MSASGAVPLSRVVELRTEKVTGRRDPRRRYIGLEHIAENEPRLLGTLPSSASASTNSVFAAGDILFGKLRPNLRKSIRVEFDGYCSTDILVLRPRNGVCTAFATHVMRSDAVFARAIATAEGTRMPRTSWKELATLPVRLPDAGEQERLSSALDTVARTIAASRAVQEKLRALKAGVVADMLASARDTRSIDDLAIYVGSGVTPRGGSSAYTRAGVVFLRSQNVHFDGLLLDDVAHISPRTHATMARSEVRSNDVLLNITGASIGRCCAVPEGLGVTNANQHVCAIRLSVATQEDALFLAEVLASHVGQAQIDQLNAGGSREGLNYKQVRSLRVPWPTGEERRSAAASIEKYKRRLAAQAEITAKHELIYSGMSSDLLFHATSGTRSN